jgi:hypothetical protein
LTACILHHKNGHESRNSTSISWSDFKKQQLFGTMAACANMRPKKFIFSSFIGLLEHAYFVYSSHASSSLQLFLELTLLHKHDA